MTFAVPLFLIAAIAGAIPVVLHMINRQQAKKLPFPTLRFLRISAEKTKRRRRIHDLFLMLLRMAALVLVALALAKPTLTNLKSLFGKGSTAMAIVLDNSGSMALIDHDSMRFDTAKRAAAQIVDQFHDGDLIALFITCGKPFEAQGKLEHNADQANQMLANVKLSYERADLAGRVDEARKLLAKSDAANRQIFVISDMQATSWEAPKNRGELPGQAAAARAPAAGTAGNAPPEKTPAEKTADAIPLIFVDCNRSPKPNVAVQSVRLDAPVPVAGLPIKASVELYNASPKPEPRLVELYIDGNKEGSSPVLMVPADGTIRHEFVFTFKTGGLHRGEARLVGEDGSKLDDRRYFTLEVDQGIPVAVVKSERHDIPYLEDTFYIEKALDPGRSSGWALRVAPLTANQLAGEPLNSFRVIYLVNLPAPSDEVAGRLRAYVEQGGNLIWIAGDNVKPEEYNPMDTFADHRLLPLPLGEVRAPAPGTDRDSWHISFLDKKHRAMAPFVEPASLYEKVLIYKHVQFDAKKADKGVWIMARLDDGEPLLVQKKVERGTVTFLGTGTHLSWTNLPLRPLFLPLFAKLTFELAGAEQVRHEGLAGVPLVLQFENQIRPSVVEIVTPSGETIRRDIEPAAPGAPQEYRYTDTYEVGVYSILMRSVSPKQIGYAVNIDPSEALSAKVPPEDLKGMYGTTPLVFAENPDDLHSTFDWLRQGKSLWSPALAAVLVLLVFETLISNGLSPKREEDQPFQNLPPGMRRLAQKSRADVLRGAT
jgi:hypothetical protein